ncbi:eudesmanediol synthase-like [Oryza brachyantha]|uniref:eudesmanediol synthase-like n=1 Tax=Oryza brachyantha TaxID=4533 RepID=UPI001ADA36EE|nr:eudesmanediol synthase-like [Oryza brachyantha]
MATGMKAAVKQPEDVNGSGGDDVPFDPSMWRDYFITYTAPLSQARTEEWMRARAETLTGEVRRTMLDVAGDANDDSSAAAMLVDTLERLGLDGHFRQEIGAAMGRLCREVASDRDDLHTVALRFRLLRQHGLRVSADVFDKFREGSGDFSPSLRNDSRGLLSLYNAAHTATPNEASLNYAIAFARRHLEAMKDELTPPMAKQVSRALDIPLPRFPRRHETMNYLAEYEKEDEHNSMLLELARLDFDLARSLHLKELKTLSMWWRELYDSVKLSYARDRLVESYLWICGVFHEEDYSRARIMFAKFFGLLSLMDDTYDVHATLDECFKLNEAIQRWDESAVSILPKYLRVFYIKLLNNFNELEDSLEPHEKYRISYTRNAFKLSSEYYLREAKWSNENYAPSFAEQLEVSSMSSYPLLAPAMLMGVGDDGVATAEAFEWAAAVPDMISASGEVARFLNDIASHVVRKSKKDVPSTVECYMAEHGMDGEAAVAAVAALAERAWRTINRAFLEMDPSLLPAARLIVNLTKMLEVIYLGGGDVYTFGDGLKGLISSLFLKPAIVYTQ